MRRSALVTFVAVGIACSSGSGSQSDAKAKPGAAQPQATLAPAGASSPRGMPIDHDPAPAPGAETKDATGETDGEVDGTDDTTGDTTDGPLQPATALLEGDKADEVLNQPAPDGALPSPEIADVGKHAFEAIKANDVDKLMELTPFGNAAVKDACPELSGPESALEVKARLKYCYEQIAWDTVSEARMGGGEPTGAAAEGCTDDVQELERLRMLVETPTQNWEIDLMGAVGRDGKALGFSGEVACRKSKR